MKSNKTVSVNKFGLPVHVGAVTKSLLQKRITMIQKVIDTGRPLKSKKKLSKKDLYKASLNLYTFRWQLKKLAKPVRKSSKKKAS